jgi:hypothetical protein
LCLVGNTSRGLEELPVAMNQTYAAPIVVRGVTTSTNGNMTSSALYVCSTVV